MSEAPAVCGLCDADGSAAVVVDEGGAAASHPASSVAPETAAVAFQFINTFTSIVLFRLFAPPATGFGCAMIRRAPCNVPKSFRENVAAPAHRRRHPRQVPVNPLSRQAARGDRR